MRFQLKRKIVWDAYTRRGVAYLIVCTAGMTYESVRGGPTETILVLLYCFIAFVGLLCIFVLSEDPT